MKKGRGSESTVIIGPSKSVLFYALHSLEYVLVLDRFRVFVPKLYYIIVENGLKRSTGSGTSHRSQIGILESWAHGTFIYTKFNILARIPTLNMTTKNYLD